MDLWLPPKPAIILPAEQKLLLASVLVAPPLFKSVAARDKATYVSNGTSSFPNSVYTFSNQNIGAAFSGRFIAVILQVSSDDSLNSVTIDGASAIIAVNIAGNGVRSAIAILQKDTGTTATIVVNLATSAGSCGIGVFQIADLQSATPFDTASVTTNNTQNPSVVLDVPANGCAIAWRTSSGSSNQVRTHTWVGVDEDYDLTQSGPTGRAHTAGHINLTTAQTNRAISCNASGTVVSSLLVAASFH